MQSLGATVFVVDDDAEVRNALAVLVKLWGFNVEAFASAHDFLQRCEPETSGCLIVDLRMPGMDGFGLQQAIYERNCEIPMIFISGHGDIRCAVRAIKSGAIDFLEKPFSDQVLFERVQQALRLDARQRHEKMCRRNDAERLATLTPRERQVLELLCSGLSGKQIAIELGISYKTLEKFRAGVMAKMQAGSVAELTTMALSLGVVSSASRVSKQPPVAA